MDGSKRCPQCGQTKSPEEFYAKPCRGDGLSGWCSACDQATRVDRARRQRAEVLAALGGVCTRCGFSDPRALHVDHVEGGGNEERRANGWRITLQRILDAPDRFQVLCASDNHRKKVERGECRDADSYPARGTAGGSRRKRCPRCKETKQAGDWYANSGRRDGLSVYCANCMRAIGDERSLRLRVQLVDAMGGRCVDCGETDLVVLCVDHVNGDGHEERALSANIAAFARKVLAERDRYALRCHNCNWIKRVVMGENRSPYSYSRLVPTERIKGPGKGSHPNTKAALRNWIANATPEQIAVVAAARVSPEANAKRSASLERTWAGKTEEQRLVIRANQSEARRRSRGARVAAETTVHPSWAAHGLERCADCGTRAKPHGTKGMCKACYMRGYMAGRVKA